VGRTGSARGTAASVFRGKKSTFKRKIGTRNTTDLEGRNFGKRFRNVDADIGTRIDGRITKRQWRPIGL
jgi:hypothetical protein